MMLNNVDKLFNKPFVTLREDLEKIQLCMCISNGRPHSLSRKIRSRRIPLKFGLEFRLHLDHLDSGNCPNMLSWK